jgi:hypothetical protein
MTMNFRPTLSVLLAFAIGLGDAAVYAQSPGPAAAQESPSQDVAPLIPAEQLDSLVAPIALYPDPLLAQTLAASTYPLEIIQLQQWLERNAGLEGKALADGVAQQPWDASVQAMAVLPDVVKRLADDIQWTTDLGNAFLAQQAGVMDAVQRMRQKAQGNGQLKSTEHQVVETEVIETKSVIVIESAAPDTVYVPSYDPYAVYGPPVYPYPPIYYPPAGYYAAGMAVSFGVGVAMGAFWGGGGGWGWGAGWGDNDITINNNNNFVRNANVRSGTVGNKWEHRPEHRGGAPYRDRATANKFGGAARGESLANRQSSARQQIGREGGRPPSTRGVGTSGTGARERAGQSQFGDAPSRDGGAARDRATGSAGTRSGETGLSSRGGGGGADRIGGRDVSRGGGAGEGSSAFGGGSRSYDGSRARASSSRGTSSMQSRGGGASRGGGGGGRSRGGGGRR